MKIKTKFTALIVAFLITTVGLSQEKKVASPAETVKGKINGADVTIMYGSPSVKGRTIWGELVPFDAVWRAGANDATMFITDKPLTVEGQKLPAGKYSLFVIPNQKETTIIFNRVAKQWGAYDYDEKKDQLRVKVKPLAKSDTTERLNYTVNKDNVTLSWEKWNIVIPIK